MRRNSSFIVVSKAWFIIFLFFIIAACNNEHAEQKILHCYAPGNSGVMQVDSALLKISKRPDTSREAMKFIPAGEFNMGASAGEGFPEEYPQHKVYVNAFWIDIHEVTNAEFALFIKQTDYITTAERKPDWEVMKLQLPAGTAKPPDSILVAGSLVFTPTTKAVSLNDPSQWWHFVAGADWRHPEGPQSNIAGKENHPVVQVSWEDAMAYCKWSGKRLPTEAEWEWAAKGGVQNAKYSWGNQELSNDFIPANIWQGNFPYNNLTQDKYFISAPAISYAPNGYGLFNMSGNVWEWCGDWMDASHYETLADKKNINPVGPTDGGITSHPYQKVLKGGSFLCHQSYCTGYRTARRSSSGWDSGSNHAGFRCVK